jgi:predicted DsbA family dithiol-disulfide isomerase
VTSDEVEARMFGVQGVPFVALDRRMAITGAQDPATYAEGLRRALAEPPPGGTT